LWGKTGLWGGSVTHKVYERGMGDLVIVRGRGWAKQKESPNVEGEHKNELP